jgi:hypothetical protein
MKKTTTSFKSEKPDECCLCFEKMTEDKPLECGHWLHLECVKKHFKPECPVCRAKLNIKVTGKVPESNIEYLGDREGFGDNIDFFSSYAGYYYGVGPPSIVLPHPHPQGQSMNDIFNRGRHSGLMNVLRAQDTTIPRGLRVHLNSDCNMLMNVIEDRDSDNVEYDGEVDYNEVDHEVDEEVDLEEEEDYIEVNNFKRVLVNCPECGKINCNCINYLEDVD